MQRPSRQLEAAIAAYVESISALANIPVERRRSSARDVCPRIHVIVTDCRRTGDTNQDTVYAAAVAVILYESADDTSDSIDDKIDTLFAELDDVASVRNASNNNGLHIANLYFTQEEFETDGRNYRTVFNFACEFEQVAIPEPDPEP